MNDLAIALSVLSLALNTVILVAIRRQGRLMDEAEKSIRGPRIGG